MRWPDTLTPDRVRLASLRECAAPVNGNGNVGIAPCFAPTRFEWSQAAPALQPLAGFGFDGVPFYPLPAKAELEKKVPYLRVAAQVVGDFDADGDADFLVWPEWVNTEEGVKAVELWRTDAQVAAPVQTNIAPWSATAWTSRAGTVLPAQGVATVWNFKTGQLEPIQPEAVKTGRSRDDKATQNAFAINYDGSYGTDVLVGELVTELAGAGLDTPWGVGSDTAVRRDWVDEGSDEHPLSRAVASEADYTGHPGFMKGLKVLRLRPGSTSEFSETSLNYRDGRPLLWAQPLDMNGDGLTDVAFCKADANYAAWAGVALPMFYGAGDTPTNWVSGRLHYALNVPGSGINLVDGGTPMGSLHVCHAKDAYLTLDLHGDGRESLLHYVHPHVGKTTIAQLAPAVPDFEVDDPFPYTWDDTLTGYWQTLREYTWALTQIGEAYYQAYTYTPLGVEATATTLHTPLPKSPQTLSFSTHTSTFDGS
jgi:hypothetical protein